MVPRQLSGWFTFGYAAQAQHLVSDATHRQQRSAHGLNNNNEPGTPGSAAAAPSTTAGSTAGMHARHDRCDLGHRHTREGAIELAQSLMLPGAEGEGDMASRRGSLHSAAGDEYRSPDHKHHLQRGGAQPASPAANGQRPNMPRGTPARAPRQQAAPAAAEGSVPALGPDRSKHGRHASWGADGRDPAQNGTSRGEATGWDKMFGVLSQQAAGAQPQARQQQQQSQGRSRGSSRGHSRTSSAGQAAELPSPAPPRAPSGLGSTGHAVTAGSVFATAADAARGASGGSGGGEPLQRSSSAAAVAAAQQRARPVAEAVERPATDCARELGVAAGGSTADADAWGPSTSPRAAAGVSLAAALRSAGPARSAVSFHSALSSAPPSPKGLLPTRLANGVGRGGDEGTGATTAPTQGTRSPRAEGEAFAVQEETEGNGGRAGEEDAWRLRAQLNWDRVHALVVSGRVAQLPGKARYSVVSAAFKRLFPDDFDRAIPVM